MGSELNLPIKWSVSIGTKLNFDGETHGHSDGDDKCKQAFGFPNKPSKSLQKWVATPIGQT